MRHLLLVGLDVGFRSTFFPQTVVFGINLRQHFYSIDVIEASCQRANVLKINEEELVIVSELLRLGTPQVEQQCRLLMERFSLDMLVLTCGCNGSYIFTPVETSFRVTPQVQVADTVGAGDSFTATLVADLLKGYKVDATLINPRYLNAVDAATLEALKKNHRLVVTLEDGCKDGGFGERIASYYSTSDMKVLVGGVKKGLYDRFKVDELLADNRLLDSQIAEDIMNILWKK